MKISYNWLKEYIDFDLSPEELKNKLTFAGIEVEAVIQLGEDLKQIKIARIIKREKHPAADKLSVCEVDDGEKILQVVCGAPNCDANQLVAFAPIGAQIGEFKIKKAKLRGVESYGMICSEQELGISDNHDGIMVLPEDAPLGENLASYLHLEDTVYDVEITPNRPDLLGMIGVARDLSALLNLKLKLPEIEISENEKNIQTALTLRNEVPKLCTRYTARVIRNVKITESPEWLKRKLISVGLRPINNVVDVTNFVMMEFGHPLHAFDLNKVEANTIVVRKAQKGEQLPALDENTYTLRENDIVIADVSKPIALAGIIGATNSHITSETTDIVIEAANFLYSSIRKTGGRLKISTDSSYRFERNLSDETADIVSRRAAQLILELAGGELLEGKLDSYPQPVSETVVALRPSRVKKILTINLTDEKIIEYLHSLGLELQKSENDNLFFRVPHFRKDLTREIDLIEEIIRLYGYNNVPQQLKLQHIMDKEKFFAKREIQDLLVNYGFSEVINWSFGNPEDLNLLRIPENDSRRNVVKIKNPLGNSFSIMRPTLIPDLLKNALFNLNHQERNQKLFEMNKVYTRQKGEKLATEKLQLTGLLTGKFNSIYWREKPRDVDFFDVKGIVENILEIIKLEKVEFGKSEEPFYQPGMAADVYVEGKFVGSFGKFDPKIAQNYEIEQPIFILDLCLQDMFSLRKKTVPEFHPIPKYPSVIRDFSFVISKNIKYSEIEKTIYGVHPKIIKNVVLFDEYAGKNIKEGFHSLALSIVFNSEQKTLTDDFVNKLSQKILGKLKNEFNIEMR